MDWLDNLLLVGVGMMLGVLLVICAVSSDECVMQVRGVSIASSHADDAGYDLLASEACVVKKRKRRLVKTGLHVAVPSGTYGRVAPRSGLAMRHGIDVGAGVVDRGYTGEIKVLLINHSDTDYRVHKNDSIAQLIVTSIEKPRVVLVDQLRASERGAKGFGSSGY